jgi:diguanylate cyclase (GGDEF)-like protein
LQGRNPLKIVLSAALLFTVVLTVACLVLPEGFAVTAISDICSALLMLCALLAFAINGVGAKGRMRLFWFLQAVGWALWLGDQICWIIFDLFLRRKIPTMYPADALLFLAGAPMIAGVLLRPHRQPGERNVRLGVLDFLLLALWWLYLYASFVVCWQYVSPNEAGYNRNFDFLAGAETVLLAAVLLFFWHESAGPWKKFYAIFCAAVVFNGVAFYVLNRALEQNVYYTGSWYDIPYSTSFTVFSIAALYGQRLVPDSPKSADDRYSSSMASLAMMAVLSLPIVALFAMLDSRLPRRVEDFRVVVTLVTMFLMAFLLFIQHRRLNRELSRTNIVLQEASLTDPLTGLRNRRYFSATIEADVGQALRSHADKRDPHTRDLVFYLIDADNFKEVNDQYGHDVGDKVLVEMAHRLSSSIRHSDVLVRWGGEEFLIVSRYTDRNEADLLAQRVLAAVADKPFSLGESGEQIYRTCSLGWAAFPWFLHDPRGIGYEEVLALADRGLREAKNSGKNCAVGMLPMTKTGTTASSSSRGLQHLGLQVEVLPVSGPRATK